MEFGYKKEIAFLFYWMPIFIMRVEPSIS